MATNPWQYNQSEGVSTNSTNTYSEKVNLTFTPNVQSDYLILGGAELASPAADDDGDVRVQIDNTTTIGNLIFERDEGDVYSNNFTVADIRTLDATQHNIDMDWRRGPTGTGAVSIRRGRLMAIPVSSYESEVTEGDQTVSSDTYTTFETLTFTPSATADYLIIAFCESNHGGTTESLYIRCQIDSTDVVEKIREAQDVLDWYPFFTCDIRSLDNSSHTITIQAALTTGQANCTLRRCRIFAIPVVANNIGYHRAVSESYTTNGTTTPSNKTTLTWTPSEPRDYYFLATYKVGGDASQGTDYNTYTDFYDNNATAALNERQLGFETDIDRHTTGNFKKQSLTDESQTRYLRQWSGSLADPDGGMGNARILALYDTNVGEWYGIRFRAASDEYLASVSSFTPPANCSVAFWMYARSTDSIIITREAAWQIYLDFDGAVGRIESELHLGTGGSLKSNTVIHPGHLYHVVCTRASGGNAAIYINGASDNTNTDHDGSPSAGTLNIGFRTGLNYYNGFIDDVRIYNRVISAAEVKTIYETFGCDGIADGLIHRWTFNEEEEGDTASGVGSVKDRGTSGLNMTATNTPEYRASILKIRRFA